jgi:predicted DNA-binding mobile mystery protein A
MSGSNLGRKLGVSQPSVTELERSERNGTIRLETLRRAAEAMGCTLVYALVPTESLEGIVRRRAEELVDDRLSRVQHTMALEDQAAQVTEEARRELIRELETSGRLWDAQ